MYTDLYTKKHSKPSVYLVITAAIVSMGFFMFMYSTRSQTVTRASKIPLVRHEKVNITARQAGVFWQSEKKETGWVVYGTKPDSLNLIAADERDVSETKTATSYHYALLRNLTPDTIYYYKIVSGDSVTAQSEGTPFEIRTIKIINNASSLKPAFGKVVQQNGDSANNALVLLNYHNAYPLLTLSKITGEWLIPLQYAVDKSTLQVESFSENEKISIEVLSEDATSHVDTLVKKINPLDQTIVLGKDYKLLQEDNVLGAVSNGAVTSTNQKISILFPKDGSIIPGAKPLIKGTALPGKTVLVTVNTNPQYSFRVVAGPTGEWKVTFPTDIQPGAYTMVMNTPDAKGTEIALKSKFIIAKSGEQVLGESTAAGTITTPTPTVYSSLTPTLAVVTSTPVPVSSTSGTITPTPPVTGDNRIPFILGSIALIIIGAGLMLVY